MASNVTPSTPGAPLFFLASAYASRSVSILQTWTYKPQKRQDGSAFALTYMLLLRSCKLMGVFVIHPCLPFCWNRYKQQGPFAPPTLPGFIATVDPSATLSPSAPFPGSPVIRPTLLRRFRAGARRASPVARHILVIVPSLPPRRSEIAASVRFQLSMLPSPYSCRLGLRSFSLSRPHPRSSSLRPDDSHVSHGDRRR
jgi:hypothetical protein